MCIKTYDTKSSYFNYNISNNITRIQCTMRSLNFNQNVSLHVVITWETLFDMFIAFIDDVMKEKLKLN